MNRARTFTLAVVAMRLWAAAAAAAVPADEADHTIAIRRVLTLLNVTTEEYREGVVDGRVVLPVEYDEARAFFDEAEQRLRQAAPAAADQLNATFAGIRAAVAAKTDVSAIRGQVDGLGAAITTATGVSEQVYPGAAPSAARGRALFEENCTSCHGSSGDGRGPNAATLQPPPADFSDPAFMRGETPFDFFHMITLGRTASAMPAWENVLSLQDRWDLVSYVWTLGPGPHRLAAGQGVFVAHCAGCHGATGDAKGPLSSTLLKSVRPLNAPEALARRTDSDLFAEISSGVKDTPMPGFAALLSEEERWAAVAFVRALSLGGDDGSRASRGTAHEELRRFAGLVGLLASEYGKAVRPGAGIDELEYRESTILLDLIRERTAANLQTLGELAPAQPDMIRGQLDQIAQAVGGRRAAAEVATLAATVAQTIAASLPAPAAAAAQSDALAETRRLLAEALAAYRAGSPQATYLVSDAYFQFEPLEAKLAAAGDLKRQVEARFLELRGLLAKPGNADQAEQVVQLIGADLDRARAALAPQGSRSALIVQAATIILREGFEIVLIVGALLAYVTKSGNTHMRRPILSGTAVGVVLSLVTAYGLTLLFRGNTALAEALEGLTLLLASAVLFFVSYWLISKAEADKWQRYIHGKVKGALARGSGLALAGAAFLAVYREGVETVLFYQALLASPGSDRGAVVSGIGIGLIGLAIVYALFNRFGKRVPIRQFFLGTSILLYYLAFVFAGRGIAELQQIGWLGLTPVPGVPRIDLLGLYPTLQTLAAQGLLLVLLVYAVIVTIRQRGPLAAASEPAARTAT